MSIFRIPGLFVLILLAAVLAGGCRRQMSGTDLMPLAVGNSWAYLVHVPGKKPRTRRLAITGQPATNIFQASDGGEPGLWSWEDGFLSFQTGGSRVYLLMLPATRGSGWWTQTPEGARVWCRIVGKGEVSVPAGRFPSCVEVKMEPVAGNTEMRHWFAPGVGWVKYCYGPRGGVPWMVRELSEFHLESPVSPKGRSE